MNWPVPSAAVWADLSSPSYWVTVPDGREWLYAWAGPTFLALSIAAAGLWLVRGRTAAAVPF